MEVHHSWKVYTWDHIWQEPNQWQGIHLQDLIRFLVLCLSPKRSHRQHDEIGIIRNQLQMDWTNNCLDSMHSIRQINQIMKIRILHFENPDHGSIYSWGKKKLFQQQTPSKSDGLARKPKVNYCSHLALQTSMCSSREKIPGTSPTQFCVIFKVPTSQDEYNFHHCKNQCSFTGVMSHRNQKFDPLCGHIIDGSWIPTVQEIGTRFACQKILVLNSRIKKCGYIVFDLWMICLVPDSFVITSFALLAIYRDSEIIRPQLSNSWQTDFKP